MTVLALLASVFCAPSQASVVTRAGDVTIRSQSSVIDLATGTREYRGNVQVSHGNLVLRAERLVEIRRDNVVERLIAHGRDDGRGRVVPVRFEQTPPWTRALRSGTAMRAVYTPGDAVLQLWRYAVRDVGGNRLRGRRGVFRFGAH